MDTNQFDAMARRCAANAPRRTVLGLIAATALGLASAEKSAAKKKKVTICLNGQTLSVKKSKRGAFFKQGATAGACAASPPASPLPPSPPPPVSPPPGPPPPPTATCSDGITNGSETDVDCGGPNCPRCDNSMSCIHGGDCTSGVCLNGVCTVCLSNANCGTDANACFCDLASGNCVSNALSEDATIRQDCACAAGFTCVAVAGGNRCLPPCGGSEVCGGKNLCKRQPRPCGQGGNCLQPLGGGPTRCGVGISCGCTSNEQCERSVGTSAFCVSFSPAEGECECGESTSFCALPR